MSDGYKRVKTVVRDWAIDANQQALSADSGRPEADHRQRPDRAAARRWITTVVRRRRDAEGRRRVEVNDSCDSTERTWRHIRMPESGRRARGGVDVPPRRPRRWLRPSVISVTPRRVNPSTTWGQFTSPASQLTLPTALSVIAIAV